MDRIKALESNNKDKTSISTTDEIETKENSDVLVRFTHMKHEGGAKRGVSISKDGKKVTGDGNMLCSLITCKDGFRKGRIHEFSLKKVRGGFHHPLVGIVERYNTNAFKFRDDESCVLGYYYYGYQYA